MHQRLPTTKLFCSNFHVGAASLSPWTILLCCSYTSAIFTSRNPLSLSIDCWNSKSTRSIEPCRLWYCLVAWSRNGLWKGTLNSGIIVFVDFFADIFPLSPASSSPDHPCCRFLQVLLVATACSCYFLCLAWHIWTCFLAFVHHVCCHTDISGSKYSGGQTNCRCYPFANCTIDVAVCFNCQIMSTCTSGVSRSRAMPTPS